MMNASVKGACHGIALVVLLLCSIATASAQYTPHPRDFASHRFLLDDGTGNGFFGIIRLNGTLTSHIYYDFPVNASGSFIFSNSSGGQTIAGGLAVTGGLTADMLSLSTPLAATSGGTGFSSYAVGDMLYANTTTSLARLPIGSNGLILTVSGGVPTWSNTASGLLLPFNQITNGTNTGQANLEVGNGSALYPVGTGAITANRFVTAASTTDNVDLATSEVSGILPDPNVSNTLTITGGSIDGTPVGATTASTGRFTTITGTGLPSGSTSTVFTMSNAGALETRTAASLTGLIGVSTDATLTGDGTSGNPLGINVANANTWTATQTFPTTAAQGNALIASTNSGSTTVNAVRIGNGLTNTQVNDDLTISGGTVDNSPVGATTASTGRFTTITGTGLPSGSASTVFTMSNAGALETRTAASLTGLIGVSTNATLTGDGTSGNPLGINVANANTWTATQTFPTTAAQGNALIASTNSGSTTVNAVRIGNGLTNTQVNDDLTISGGTVDNSPVGATTASTGRFTTITGTGLPSGSASTVFTMSNAGALETRTAASLTGLIGVSTNATLTGDGTSGNPLGINVANANTWTATQTFPTTAAQGNALIASTNSGSTTVNAVRIGNGLTNTQVNDDLTISGGTVDNSPVGATTPSTGAFTTLGANGAVTLGNGNDNITLNAGSGVISASNDKIENVADPTAAQDAATKNYIDNTALGGVLGPFVQLGPAALQTYTGANPLIRLNETGGSAPNLMDLRTAGTQHLLLTNAGALTVTNIEGTPIGATTRSTANVTDLDANGNVTLGNAAADVVTVNGTTTFANPVTANGAVTLGNGNDNITLNAGTGIISASGDKIENVADPTAAQDAATKNYVDNGFVRLGPASAQTYTGAQPLIRLDETGASAPNLMDLRTAGTQHLVLTNAGALTATSIQATPIGTTTRSLANVTDLDANGDVILGNAAADAVTVNGTTTFANPVTANGAVTLGNGNDNITLNAGTGVISASNDKIEDVADPTAAQDAATKNYIDNTVLGGVVGPFVQLGPAALQTYTGANPLIRLNETGGGTPNLMDLRTSGTQHLLLTNGGSLTVTAIEGSPIGGTTRSTGAFTTLGANGAVTLGDGNDNITLDAGSGIISASGDKIENVADPTAAQDAATKNYIDNTALGGVIGPFVQLGPASAQPYTGAQPLIRLDETGGSAPNLMDLRTAGTQHLLLTNAGALTATSIQATPIGTTTRSLANVTDLNANGNVTLGDAAADAVTINGTTTFAAAAAITANGAVTLGNGNDNITLNAGTGVISASNDKIEDVADPTAAQDAATKNYIDNTVLGGVVGPFVQLGPAALQTYTGANPLIRLNETGGGTPNLMDLRTSGTQHLLLTNGGSLTVTAIEGSPIGGTTRSTGAFTTLDANGAVTLGNGNDNITLDAGSGIISASGDKIENVADPTAAQDAATKNYVDNGFVRLGPASAQTYTGAQPLIRLDETGGSAPNLMDLRTAGTQHLVLTNAGALTATSIQATPIGTTTRSLANVTDLDANGDVILGNAAADAVTVNGTTTFANPVTANGAVTLGNGNDNITLNAGTGIISASNDKIENVADPTAAQDAATKNYVDNQVTSAAWALGGNSAPSSNIFGTISATNIDIRTSNATRMTVGSGGGIGINATPVATTKLAIGTVDPAGGIGLGVNMTGTTTSTGIKVTNVGASGTNDAGIAISASVAGTGIGLRIGGGAGNNLATGINLTGGTGISYNAATAGSGTGISVGGTTRPATGGSFEASTVAVQAQTGATGNGVIASTATSPVAPPTGVAIAGFSQNNTGNTTSRGVYGQAASTGTGASTTTYGAVGIADNTGGTNSGLAVGVHGSASGAGNGTNAVVGGFFQTTGSTGNRFAIVANGGGDVYLGSSDADRPSTLTAGSYIGTGNTNTTYMNAIRSSGTAGTANVRMGSLSGAALTGSYSPGANDGIIVADNNGDLLKRSIGSVIANAGVQYSVSSAQATATPRTNHLFDVAYAGAAPNAAATGARITSEAAGGNNNATALTLVATPAGTGIATAVNATGNIVLATTGSQISNSAGDVTVADNVVVNSGAGTDLTISESGVDRNNAADQTFAIDNSGAGGVRVLVNGATSVTNSRVAVANGHVTSQQTTAPTTGTLGTGVTSAVLTRATDVAGLLNITTNGTPATGAQTTVTFNLPYGTAPIVVVTPANGAGVGVGVHVTATTTGFTVNFNGLPAASTSHQFSYHVIETQ